jgi:glutamate/tyrosine decarboxylase-like PLP-dependent enzyme
MGVNGKLTFYGSSEMHSSIQRDLETLGVGNEQLRRIPSDENYKIRIDELDKRIEEDKKNGYTPVCVIGNSGSTNTGSFDDFNALSELCKEKNLWLHVDGAFGAWVALSQKYKHLVSGQEKADSLSFDLHKWMYMPFGIGCTLVRDADAHYHTFSAHAEYIAHEDRWLIDYGPELSRPFRALKAWMCLKEHGFDKYGRLIEQNIDQAKYLKSLIMSHAELELLAPVASNVVCFRYVREGVDEKGLDVINQRIFEEGMKELEFGYWPSKVGDRFAIRICIVNHRTRREDLAQFVDWVLETGKKAT